MNLEDLRGRLLAAAGLSDDSLARRLIHTYVSETQTSSAGYPALSEEAFSRFRDGVPQLFRLAGEVLDTLGRLEEAAQGETSEEVSAHLKRAARVIRTMLNTCLLYTSDAADE